MFSVNKKLRVFNLMAFWATILFAVVTVSCLDSDPIPNSNTPTPAHPLANTPVGSSSEIVLLPDDSGQIESLLLPTDQFTKTITFFLLDVSTSIQKLCEPEFQEWRTQIPEFFITYVHEYHHNEQERNEEFKIGLATFPTATNPLEVTLNNLDYFNNYSNWFGELKRVVQDYKVGLGFADALETTFYQLNSEKYNEYEKIIVVISDTYLSYTRSLSEVVDEKTKISSVIRKMPPDWRLYVVQLPCTKVDGNYEYPDSFRDDIDFWSGLISPIQNAAERDNRSSPVHLFHRDNFSTSASVISAWFRGDDQLLTSLLPWESHDGRYGWGWVDGQNIFLKDEEPANWQTYGDTSRLDITVVAINASGFTLHAMGDLVDGSNSDSVHPMLYKYYKDWQGAQNNCENYVWEFTGQNLQQNTIGIFWWQAEYPTPQITASVMPSTTIHNPTSFRVEANLRGGSNYPSCYRGRLKINEGIYGNVEGETEFRDINALLWLQVPYDVLKIPPPEFSVVVEIVRRNHNTIAQSPILIQSDETIVQVNFTPDLLGSSINNAGIIETSVFMTFAFGTQDYYDNKIYPEIYLLTDKTRDQQTATGCRKDNFSDDNVPVHGDNLILNDMLNNTQWYALAVDSVELQTTIRISISKAWQEHCSYAYLFLQWPNTIHDASWPSVMCALKTDKTDPCHESTLKVVNK